MGKKESERRDTIIDCNCFEISVQVEEETTQAWYAAASKWGCDCGHCLNFLALAEKKALPVPLLDILSHFGIPPEKATYVCELCPTERGHCYEGSYRMAGTILDEREMDFIQHDWGTVRCWHDPYPYGAPGFPNPHFDLSVAIELPWILEESKEGEYNESEQ